MTAPDILAVVIGAWLAAAIALVGAHAALGRPIDIWPSTIAQLAATCGALALAEHWRGSELPGVAAGLTCLCVGALVLFVGVLVKDWRDGRG